MSNKNKPQHRYFTLNLDFGENPVPHEVVRKIKNVALRGALNPLEEAVRGGSKLHGAPKLLFSPQIVLELAGKETVVQSTLDPRKLLIDTETGFPYAPTREEAALDVINKVRDILDHTIRYATWAERMMIYTRAQNWTAPFPERPVVNYWRKVQRYVFGDTWEDVYQTLQASGAGVAATSDEPLELQGLDDSPDALVEVDDGLDLLPDPDPVDVDFGAMAEVADTDPMEVEYTQEQFEQEMQWVTQHLPAEHPAHSLGAMVEHGDLPVEDAIKSIQGLRQQV